MATAHLIPDRKIEEVLADLDAGRVTHYGAHTILATHFFEQDPTGNIEEACWRADRILADHPPLPMTA